MNKRKLVRDLKAVLQTLENNGWTAGMMQDQAGRHCLVGAMDNAVGPLQRRRVSRILAPLAAARNPYTRRIGQMFPTTYFERRQLLIDFNDSHSWVRWEHPARNPVIEFLREVIATYEPKEPELPIPIGTDIGTQWAPPPAVADEDLELVDA